MHHLLVPWHKSPKELGQNLPNASCHFSKYKSVPLEALLYFFGSNIIYFWQKQRMKVQICRLATVLVKIHQFSYVIFQATSQYYFKFWLPFSVMTHNSFGHKEVIKVQIFGLSTACMKISQIPYVIFQARSQYYFTFCITLQFHNT